jgi:hypothetical protein
LVDNIAVEKSLRVLGEILDVRRVLVLVLLKKEIIRWQG